jgi:pimeloyl-ACP methyl ester carboxylesterase
LQPGWKSIVDTDPKVWQAASSLPKLTEADLKQASKGCWFPVHAFGYNWLQSNGDSAKLLAKRINDLIAQYKQHSRCEKVIIVTHSMGGLVGRALAHPAYGNMQDKILGIVHGVMPATGAPAAYRRMLAGFESGNIAEKAVLGNCGPDVMAVLGNAPGGLELLPSISYGPNWLKIVDAHGQTLKQLPVADPYGEIYSRSDVWWGMLRAEWVNPAGQNRAGVPFTQQYLKRAKNFHQDLANYYHPNCYAHYGCDANRKAFRNVVWQTHGVNAQEVDGLVIKLDNEKGDLILGGKSSLPKRVEVGQPAVEPIKKAKILPPADPGDQTVPMQSADDQLKSGKFKGVFRQTGYEHQASYQDKNALASTLYSIVQIAKQMNWEGA